MKRLSALLLVALLSITSVFAVSFKLSVGQTTGADLTFEVEENSSPSINFNFNVDAELDIDIDKGQGVVVVVNPYAESGGIKIAMGAGYAYQCKIGSDVYLVTTVGPKFSFGGDTATIGAFVLANFDFYLGKYMFVRVATGLDMWFGEMNDKICKDMKFVIPLPKLAVGWRF